MAEIIPHSDGGDLLPGAPMKVWRTRPHPSGVEPICRELQVAPSTYDAAEEVRPPSARSVVDAVLGEVVATEHGANYGVYGPRKTWKHLRRSGRSVGRCRVERLMRAADLHGAAHGRAKRTTIACRAGDGPPTWSTGRSPRPRRTSCGSRM